jgi:hypothetical protein
MWRPSTANERISRELVEQRLKKKEWYRDSNNAFFYFGKFPVGRGTEHEFDNMVEGLTNILRDENLLQSLSSLEADWQDLQNHTARIRDMAIRISNLINDDLYNNRVRRCCPGWWFPL